MNPHEAYVLAVFNAMFPHSTVTVAYAENDEMWHVIVTAGNAPHFDHADARVYHYSMQVTSDDDDYIFTEADDDFNVIRFPIITVGEQAIWETEPPEAHQSTTPDVGQRMVDDRY